MNEEFENNNNRRKRMRLHLVPPDDTDMSAAADEDTLSSMSSDDDFSQLEQHCQQQEHLSTPPPQCFICPLTMEIMFDPVLDNEGNSFERMALLDWLKDTHASPISRQPLCASRLIPNAALRQIIHGVMGPDWVSQKTEEQARHQAAGNDDSNKINGSKIPTTISIQSSLSSLSPPPSAGTGISATRAQINCFLQTTEKALGIPNLSLNEDGCCAFQQGGVTIVLDVPENIGVFCFYTRDLLPDEYYLNSATSIENVYRTALEMNFLQGDTRGGCLSIRHDDSDEEETSSRSDDARPEILFSYTDRVHEVGAQDFTNILLNFLDTAKSLRDRLVRATQVPEKKKCSMPLASSSEKCRKREAPSL